MQSVLDQVWDALLPAMGPAPLPENPGAQKELARKLEGLAFPVPEGEPGSPMQGEVSGKRYAIEANPAGIESVSFDFSEDGCLFKLKDGSGEEQAACGLGAWRVGTSSLLEHRPKKLVASGAWTARDTFAVTLRFYESPFCFTLACRLTGNRLRIDTKVNVSFGNLGYPPLDGQIL